MCVLVLNVVDVSRYGIQRMEVDSAAHYGAMAAFKTCDLNHLPATSNCPGLNNAVSSQVTQTSLGSSVTLSAGAPSEGYYCLTAQNTLQFMGGVGNKPTDCSAVGNPGVQPVDYLQVQVTYPYSALFPLSVGSLFPTPIVKSTLIRMG